MAKEKTGHSRRDFIKTASLAGAASLLAGTGMGAGAAQAAEEIKVPRRPFGRTGVEVSTLSLGGIFDIVSNQMVLHQALKLGVDYWGHRLQLHRGAQRAGHRQLPGPLPPGAGSHLPGHQGLPAQGRGPGARDERVHEADEHQLLRLVLRALHHQHLRGGPAGDQGLGGQDEAGGQVQALRLHHSPQHGKLPGRGPPPGLHRRHHDDLQLPHHAQPGHARTRCRPATTRASD